MDRTPAHLYRNYPADALGLLGQSLERWLHSCSPADPIPVFFRADDIGVISDSFTTLLRSFSSHGVPLCLAVVPVWMTSRRWAAMAESVDISSPLWCWHQHGWKHQNHEPAGKKNEFGPSRNPAEIRDELLRGKRRLQDVLGSSFSPYFTPPWNRCSPTAGQLLKELGFKALSQSVGTPHTEPMPLPDLAINIDLHTRKEPDSASCLAGLATELEAAIRSGTIGIMIHHQRMNREAFNLLDGLLYLFTHHRSLRTVDFRDLAG